MDGPSAAQQLRRIGEVAPGVLRVWLVGWAAEMCGIAGTVSRTPAAFGVHGPATAAVLGAISHRGPDACGEYRDGKVWLGHRRLSILDLSSSANQPMTTPSGRHVICYNGEVYNYRELAGELSLEGLRSRSDTEVVLRAFEALGASA